MKDCLFCKISKREIPARIVYEDADLFAFEDIAPQAPTHVLICPRRHVTSLDDLSVPLKANDHANDDVNDDANDRKNDANLIGRLMIVAAELARERGITGGYRTVINNGVGAGQSVFHLHVHLLGGREFRWPPG